MTKRTFRVAVLILLGFTCLRCDSRAPVPDGTRFVLITIDTTRVDHLSCFGYGKNTSPNIDRLASQGVKFTNCYASMPTTDPAHVSILTGSYPRTHGVMKNGMEVSNPDVSCIAEWFKEKGCVTAAITSRAHVNPNSLKLKGFDYVRAPEKGQRRADAVFRDATEFLDEHGRDKFFLWVHFFDPHVPYDPPSPYGLSLEDDLRALLNEKRKGLLPEGVKWTPEEIDYMKSMYDGEIRYMDYYIGELLDLLDDIFAESESQPFIILVGDHGEALGELQDRWSFAFDHGKFLYEQLLRVPLIFSWKGTLPEGKVVDSLVSAIDIAPTIIDLVGGEEVAHYSGMSLKGLIEGKTDKGRDYAFAQRRLFTKSGREYLVHDEVAVISPRYKLIENQVKGLELYDLANDEHERTNLSTKKADVARELCNELVKWQDEYPSFGSNQVISDEKKEALKALGYLP